MRIRLPNNWRPRPYQRPAWDYLERGGRHAELIWHRRSGKDEICLHRTAVAAFERQATYWHMLPEAAQARKAIWEAVNPHTGRRRIDEAFPHEIRGTTKDHEMMIRFKNGSTWQVVGSDNYNSLVGSPPVGVVFSEWALANPSARAYLRPIFLENNGWQVYITTPRGKNHAYNTYRAALKEPGAFAQVLSAHDTGTLTPEQLAAERSAYINDFGLDQGDALFEQEYECSFDAAVLGTYYARYINELERRGHVCPVAHDPAFPVFTAWDIGRTDDTVIWFFQVIAGELRVIDYESANMQDVGHYAGRLIGKEVQIDIIENKVRVLYGEPIPDLAHRTAYRHEKLYLPHDAVAKTLASSKSTMEQLAAVFGVSKCALVPGLSLQDGIQAARAALGRCYFDEERCADGLEALKLYRREWDDDKKTFKDKPLHDWCSHPADAFRYLAIAWRAEKRENVSEPPLFPIRGQGVRIVTAPLDTLWGKPKRQWRI